MRPEGFEKPGPYSQDREDVFESSTIRMVADRSPKQKSQCRTGSFMLHAMNRGDSQPMIFYEGEDRRCKDGGGAVRCPHCSQNAHDAMCTVEDQSALSLKKAEISLNGEYGRGRTTRVAVPDSGLTDAQPGRSCFNRLSN